MKRHTRHQFLPFKFSHFFFFPFLFASTRIGYGFQPPLEQQRTLRLGVFFLYIRKKKNKKESLKVESGTIPPFSWQFGVCRPTGAGLSRSRIIPLFFLLLLLSSSFFFSRENQLLSINRREASLFRTVWIPMISIESKTKTRTTNLEFCLISFWFAIADWARISWWWWWRWLLLDCRVVRSSWPREKKSPGTQSAIQRRRRSRRRRIVVAVVSARHNRPWPFCLFASAAIPKTTTTTTTFQPQQLNLRQRIAKQPTSTKRRIFFIIFSFRCCSSGGCCRFFILWRYLPGFSRHPLSAVSSTQATSKRARR